MRSQLTKKNLISLFVDWAVLSHISFLILPNTSLLFLGHVLIPILWLPFFRYFSFAIFCSTPGFFLMRLQRLHPKTGAPTRRLFDWVFESELKTLKNFPASPALTQTILPILLVLGVFYQGSRVISKDPSMIAYPTFKPSLFAPEPSDKNWNVLAFFYASGAWPINYHNHPVLYSLPYEKGPPERFVGKIQIFWELPGAKVTLLGPLTLDAPKEVSALKKCFTISFKCIGLRRALMSRQLKPFFEKADLKNAAWFEVENPALNTNEMAQGLYFSGPAKNGHGWVEAYYLINSKMALQGILLERSEDASGIEASETLKKVVASQRMVSDLLAPRTWVNSQIAKIKLTEKSPKATLIQVQAYLLSKVSVDPKDFDSFYHLGGLSMLLFEKAMKTHEVELTSTSKQTILSTYQFGEDVDPKNPKLKELEFFKAQLTKGP